MKTALPTTVHLQPRPRLFATLDAQLEVPLVWLHAPGGAGKTSVLASYAVTRGANVLWYEVDASDADPASLFVALTEHFDDASAIPHYDRDSTHHLRQFSRAFFAAAARHAGQALYLVLDDFHAGPATAMLAEVLDAVAGHVAGLRVLVASRLPPPGMLVRRQVHGTMLVVSWAQLRMTAEESAQLVRALNPGADAARLADLYRVTDGWPAGLKLLARSEALPQGLAADAAERGLLREYFLHESLSSAPPRHREALCAAALLPPFDADILGELLDIDDAERLLGELVQQPYFLERVMAPRDHWRFHPLMREFLQSQLDSEFSPERLHTLRQRAANIAWQYNEIDLGLALLHDDRDHAGLAQALTAHAPTWLAQGRGASILRWTPYLPAELQDQPWIAYWTALARLALDPDAALAALESIYARFAAAGDRRGELLACAGALEAVFQGYAGLQRLEPWLRLAEARVAEIDTCLSLRERARVMCILFGALVFLQRPHPRLVEWRASALELIERSGDTSLHTYVITGAIMSHIWAGDYARAAVFAERLRPLLDNEQAAPLVRQVAWLALAVLAGNTPVHPPDYSTIEHGLALEQAYGVRLWSAELHGQGAVIALGAGDLVRARHYLDAMRQAFSDSHSAHSAGYHCFSAWWHLLRGEVADAGAHCAMARSAAATAASVPLQRHSAVLTVLADLAAGRVDEAATVLTTMMAQQSATQGHPRWRYAGLLLSAELHRQRQEQVQMHEALAGALRCGREHGYYGFYGWLPDMIAPLAVAALAAGIETDYVLALMERRRLRPSTPPVTIEAWPWPLRVRTLGALSWAGMAKPIRPGVKSAQKPLELLLALIAWGGDQVAESRLCDALWPDADGDAARQSLHINLHRVRRLFGDDGIVRVEAGRLSIDRWSLWVDAWALEAVFDQASTIAAMPAAAVLRLLDTVAALYRGPFLADSALACVVPMRERLAQQHARFVSEAIEALLGLNQAALALTPAQRAYDAAPDDEQLCIALIRCQLALGHVDAAIAYYEAFQRDRRQAAGRPSSRKLTELLRPYLRGADSTD